MLANLLPSKNDDEKQLWLLAGGNGAGKSTFYQRFLEPRGIRLVNADRIARKIASKAPEKASYDAAKLAECIRYELLKQSVSFCFETVFSHPSKIDFVAHAKALGYEVILVFIHLDNPELNLARVAQRVIEGGHFVPDKKIKTRLPRTLKHITKALPIADEVHLLDNSRWDNPFKRVATLKNGKVLINISSAPAWALDILSDYLKLAVTSRLSGPD